MLGASLLLAGGPRAQSVRATPVPGATPVAQESRAPAVVETQLAGNSLKDYPFFEFVRTFNQGSPVQIAVDPGRHPGVVGITADVYVVAARNRKQWTLDPRLVDAHGSPLTATFAGGSIRDNRFTVDTGSLDADAGTDIGVGYDVVIDLDRDGTLSDGDLVDGYGDEAGLYAVHDVTLPGPLEVTVIEYSGGSWLGQRTYYPTDIADMGLLPLVIVSHGNGHNYRWYDHIGEHLASYGYVVMSHQNRTGPGIESASKTTLSNTDYLIANQGTIAGGVLDGHLDSHSIMWIGHSRGGEGVTRAYDAILEGETALNTVYDLEDIRLVSSIAPTDFLKGGKSNPHHVTYSLWVGGADSDVTGCANNGIAQSFHLFDRATETRQSISLHGVGHGDFHDGGGNSYATGPCKIGRSRTHVIMRGYLLPLVHHHIRGNVPARDFLWRQWEGFRPIGAPSYQDCVVVDLMYEQGDDPEKLVLDDFQTFKSPETSSSGGSVFFTVSSLVEDRLDDRNTTFTDDPANDPMNGMTHAGPTDPGHGIVFEYKGADTFISFEVLPDLGDFSRFDYLSFRATQATRNPRTIEDVGDTTFTVTLRDGSGGSSSINIGSYGGGIEEPYQRTGCGTGAGWANEWETIRIRLADFLHDNAVDLTDVRSVDFRFGPSFGTPVGRLGLDEIELVGD